VDVARRICLLILSQGRLDKKKKQAVRIHPMKPDRLRLHAFWNSFANNVASPFVGFNVTASGAAYYLVGYVQAISTLASAVTQLVGGRIVDRTGRRVRIAGLFSVTTGLLWLGAAEFQTPTYLAIFFTAITLVLGVYAAGWTAILGEGSEGRGRGAFLGSFARLMSIGALAALLLSTVVTAAYVQATAYTLLYLISGGLFILSALVLKGQHEQKVEKVAITQAGQAHLRRYYVATGIYGLFWGFAWPLFTVTTVKVVKMTLFQFSISQVISVASTIAFQPLVGRLVDRDRKKWVFWGRMGLVVYPLVYIVFTSAWEIYAINVFSGLTNSLLNIAFAAYLFDLSPAGQRGRHSAEFNLVTGASTMAGSLAAGLALTAISTPETLWVSLAYLYVVAAAGRALGAFLHLRLPYLVGGGTIRQGLSMRKGYRK
jgi:MFS family permease